jgi:hypothetical protein
MLRAVEFENELLLALEVVVVVVELLVLPIVSAYPATPAMMIITMTMTAMTTLPIPRLSYRLISRIPKPFSEPTGSTGNI